MTNTHRKTTTRTTAKIAAVGAFGVGAAIAFPGLAAAQDTPAENPAASLENLGGEEGSLEGGLGTDLAVDAGSLSFNLNLDAEAPNPGSVEFGSLGVSPNTGSDLIDGGTGSGEEEAPAEDSGSLDTGSLGSDDAEGTDEDTENEAPAEDSGSLDTGSLPGSDDAEGTDEGTENEAPAEETGSIDTGSLAGLSSGAEDDADDDTEQTTDEATATTGSLG